MFITYNLKFKISLSRTILFLYAITTTATDVTSYSSSSYYYYWFSGVSSSKCHITQTYESGVYAPLIPNFGIRWELVFIFRIPPLYPQGKRLV
jgi:hypothetical protein